MTNILVTGGAGFIGSKLVSELIGRDDKVTVLDNLSTGSLNNLWNVHSRVEFVEGDIGNLDLVTNMIHGKEVVYHMAAEVGVERVMKKDTEVCEIDYLSAVDLFDIAAKAGVKTLLFASSSEVYGKFPQDRLPMSEDDRFTPDTVYGWAKYGAELRLKEISNKTGMAGISVRYFNVYGPGQTLNGYCVPSFVHASMKSPNIEIHGSGSQTRDLTYLDEAVKMTLAVANPEYSGEAFNIGTQTEVTMLDLANMVLGLTKSDTKIVFIEPRRPTDLYHKMGDASKILEATGLKSETHLEDGLLQCIEYANR